jgi:hypothetical protein
MTEAEDVDKVASTAEVTQTTDENPIASDAEGCLSSLDAAEGSLDEGGSNDENSQTYYFGSSTITVGKIKEMMEKGYYVEGKARAPRAGTGHNEAIMYEEFFVASLRMPQHHALADILLKFQTQLHQLMPNAIVQLSKYFWAVGSFGGVPDGNVLMKWYELQYQPKKVETPEGEKFVKYGCPNFHAKRDGGLKLRLAIKNKWSLGWTKTCFNCHIPCLRSSEGRKSVYALYKRMNELDYVVEPEVDCLDDDSNDTAFNWVTSTIGGWDAVKEFVACKMHPLASSFGFKGVTLDTTPVLKVHTLLPIFLLEMVSTENAHHILAEVETEAKKILGSFRPKEYDALTMAKLPNGGHLNSVFEQMGLAYSPCPLPDNEAS